MMKDTMVGLYQVMKKFLDTGAAFGDDLQLQSSLLTVLGGVGNEGAVVPLL